MNRGLKAIGIDCNDDLVVVVTVTSPMNRGLKEVDNISIRTSSQIVTVTSPMNRGLKERTLAAHLEPSQHRYSYFPDE